MERQRLLVEMLPLVKRMAFKIREHLPAHVEVDDLLANGVLGLVDAVTKFDATKRVKLESYARHRVRGGILDGLRGADPASRVLNAAKQLDGIAGEEKALGAETARRLSHDLAQLADGPVASRQRATKAFVEPLEADVEGLRRALDAGPVSRESCQAISRAIGPPRTDGNVLMCCPRAIPTMMRRS